MNLFNLLIIMRWYAWLMKIKLIQNKYFFFEKYITSPIKFVNFFFSWRILSHVHENKFSSSLVIKTTEKQFQSCQAHNIYTTAPRKCRHAWGVILTVAATHSTIFTRIAGNPTNNNCSKCTINNTMSYLRYRGKG